MRFIDSTYQEFLKRTEPKRIILFGASSLWDYYEKIFAGLADDVIGRTAFIVDNAPSKQGNTCDVLGKRLMVRSADWLPGSGDYVILIAVSMAYQEGICRQLSGMGLPEDVECYSLPLMIRNRHRTDCSCVDHYFAGHTEPVIPARIHSFWFSGEEKTDIYKKCVESWHKYCPGYEILEWNADSYDVTKNTYMKQAYECQKWAFVSDYARLDVVHSYGGIYLDMDVELLAPIDGLRNATAFFCRQDDGFVELGSGFGAMPGNRLIKEMLEAYEGQSLVDDAGTVDMTPQPQRLSSIFGRYGIKMCHEPQVVEDMVFLSNDYIVCGGAHAMEEGREKMLGIHWHNAGWLDEGSRRTLKKSADARRTLLEQYFKGDGAVGM